MKITTFRDAELALGSYVPPARKFRSNYTLDNMRAMMTALGNPQNSYKVIHVAGTSGKTSTAYYAAALLKQTGKRVGLTVSPHIDQLNERLQIDLIPLPEEHYCAALVRFLDILNKLTIKPTYFELLVAFAFWEFAQQNVDYAVVEVGLGGLLDGTNIIDQTDKVCVITDIGIDHTAVLGNTLTEIATQKAGIIHHHNPVFMSQQNQECVAVLHDRCHYLQAKLHVLDEANMQQTTSLPLIQQRNWNLAKTAVDYIVARDNLAPLTKDNLLKSQQVHIPARLEVVSIKGKVWVFDGAHNPQKIAALVSSLRQMYPDKKIALLFALLKSDQKKRTENLQLLLPLANSAVVTDFVTQQDMRKYATDPQQVKDDCKRLGLGNIQAIHNPKKALEAFEQETADVYLVTGSFYLLNHIRPLVLGNND